MKSNVGGVLQYVIRLRLTCEVAYGGFAALNSSGWASQTFCTPDPCAYQQWALFCAKVTFCREAEQKGWGSTPERSFYFSARRSDGTSHCCHDYSQRVTYLGLIMQSSLHELESTLLSMEAGCSARSFACLMMRPTPPPCVVFVFRAYSKLPKASKHGPYLADRRRCADHKDPAVRFLDLEGQNVSNCQPR